MQQMNPPPSKSSPHINSANTKKIKRSLQGPLTNSNLHSNQKIDFKKERVQLTNTILKRNPLSNKLLTERHTEGDKKSFVRKSVCFCFIGYLFLTLETKKSKTSPKPSPAKISNKTETKEEYVARHYRKVPKPAPLSAFLKSLDRRKVERASSENEASEEKIEVIQNKEEREPIVAVDSHANTNDTNSKPIPRNKKQQKKSSTIRSSAGLIDRKRNAIVKSLVAANRDTSAAEAIILSSQQQKAFNTNNSTMDPQQQQQQQQEEPAVTVNATNTSTTTPSTGVTPAPTAKPAPLEGATSTAEEKDEKKKTSSVPTTTTKPASKPSAKGGEDDDVVVPTKCHDWSLNNEAESDKRFWWNKTYSISIWESNMELEVNGKAVVVDPTTGRAPDEAVALATDIDVWRGYTRYQISAVYKVCPICKQPEQNVDCRICCYCSATVHPECGIKAEHENIIWKPSNKGFESHMCICFDCEDMRDMAPRAFRPTPDNARRACVRAMAAEKEYPPALRQQLAELRAELDGVYGAGGEKSAEVPEAVDAAYLERVRNIVAAYFQPGDSSTLVMKKPIESKFGGLGVVAVKDIPRFTIIGVYPGYEDPLSGEQAKLGRPGPKYSLVDLNCADFYNNVFTEMDKTFTPFINEPSVSEKSNVAWIQENIKPEGRLSVMSVRDIKAGEELLIGYGPLYPRTYPYTYDAYAYHEVDTHKNCFALWQWTSLEEKDATFVCYCGYDPETNAYSYWETEEEMIARKARERSEATGVGKEGKPPKRQGRHPL